ncbi:MAG: M12 family metallo-peptidase [Pontiella sp.]
MKLLSKNIVLPAVLVSAILIFASYLLKRPSPASTPTQEQAQAELQPEVRKLESALPTDAVDGALPVAQITPLFVSGEAESPVWTRKTPAAHRSRIIHPDAGLLTAKPSLKKDDRLELALFDDILLSSKISDVTEYPNGAVGMTARMDGAYKGTLYLSYSGGELRVHADVLGANDFYVRYEPELQSHVAIEVDRENSGYLEGCETCLEEKEKNLAEEVLGDEIASDEVEDETGNPPVDLSDLPDTVVVDVMIVYTPAARIAEGGINGINNNITLAMQKANAAHGNSNTKMTLNLVHSAETIYTESGSASTDLNALRGEDDGLMDEVHGLRNTNAADFVCLLEDEPGTGGIGGLMSDTDGEPHRAFCLARVQQSDWTYTVVHEFGHNMGCHHSKTQTTQSGPGLYDYSAGWQWADTESSSSIGYCSLMTYENFDSTGGYEYDRVGYFSNPDIDYTGDSTNPTGDATNGDNARSIRNIRHVASEFRFPVEKGRL